MITKYLQTLTIIEILCHKLSAYSVIFYLYYSLPIINFKI